MYSTVDIVLKLRDVLSQCYEESNGPQYNPTVRVLETVVQDILQ